MSTIRQFQAAFDRAEPARPAVFWREVLGYVVPAVREGFVTWEKHHHCCRLEEIHFACTDSSGVGPRVLFQRVPEGKVVENRVHLDVRVGTGLAGDDRLATLEAICALLMALGAKLC